MEEKTGGRVLASSVVSISIQLLRKGGPDAVFEHLCGLPKVRECLAWIICNTWYPAIISDITNWYMSFVPLIAYEVTCTSIPPPLTQT